MRSVFTSRFILIATLFALLGCSSMDDSPSEICFIGDSITRLWDLEKYFPEYKINKHAISGSMLEDVAQWDTEDCEDIPTVMLIGTNNLLSGTDNDTLTDEFIQTFSSQYAQIAKSFNASKFYAISILPRNEWDRQPFSLNADIRELNQQIDFALRKTGIRYEFINVHDYFLDKDGSIHWDYYYDGLHLTQEGYETLSNHIREAL